MIYVYVDEHDTAGLYTYVHLATLSICCPVVEMLKSIQTQ